MSNEYVGAHKAHTESVLLVFWGNDCSPNKKAAAQKPLSWHWSEKPPTIREVEVACVGAIIMVKHVETFDIHGVLPQCIMPRMSTGEQRMFLDALERQLIKQTKLAVGSLKQDIVDWEGMNKWQ